MESFPDINDPQRQACEKWEVKFDTDHVGNLNFAISTTLSQKRSTRSAPTDLPTQTSQLDLHIQKQMLELEALKGMGEQLSKLIDSSHVTSTEIAANTQLVKDSRKTLQYMDQKIEMVKLDLNAQIEGLRTEIGINKVHLRTIQEQVIDQGARIPNRPQTLSARQDVSARSTLKSLEATAAPTIHMVAAVVANVPRTSRSSCSMEIRRITLGLRANFEPYTKTNTTVLLPSGSCWKSCCRNRYGTRSSIVLLMEPCTPLCGIVSTYYGRTEVLDQTYLDDLLQIPPLKSQDAASLKTFANRLHRAVVTLSQSIYAQELQSRTTLIAIEAKLTTYLKEKWNEKLKKAGAELNVLDLDDWVTVKSMSKQHGKNVFGSLPT
ncbi:Uncharacterized protein APZ42_030148 [Daphnia magna]|uniref:Uncharacterized protein n=1 Tax=Daphnia magna TaxID=35525 RepID=A0A164P0Q6_9CRUS|nr:Uncharacterized protein APZ42_030148 [Daphnia magna]